MELFIADQISKAYASQQALDSVSIRVEEGSIFGLLGPNGAGKTTLIRIINQIIAPDSGQLLFAGKPLHAKDVERIGYLPEERGLYKKMKVGEQALYLAQLKGLSKKEANKRLKMWFEKFGISSWWNRKVEELSKGMQQKVQFIVTVLHEPQLLIFDEPFSGFDPINANLLRDEILELRKGGATIIFSTHNMASVEELCDNIALINKSQKILDGKVSDIKNTYRKNLYSVGCISANDVRVFLPQEFEVSDHIFKQNTQYFNVRIPTGLNSNQLVEILLPNTVLISFNEVLPSMNEIFIERVKNA